LGTRTDRRNKIIHEAKKHGAELALLPSYPKRKKRCCGHATTQNPAVQRPCLLSHCHNTSSRAEVRRQSFVHFQTRLHRSSAPTI